MITAIGRLLRMLQEIARRQLMFIKIVSSACINYTQYCFYKKNGTMQIVEIGEWQFSDPVINRKRKEIYFRLGISGMFSVIYSYIFSML